VVKSNSSGEGVVKSNSSGEGVVKSNSSGEGVVKSNSPGEGVVKSNSPGEGVVKSNSPGEDVVKLERTWVMNFKNEAWQQKALVCLVGMNIHDLDLRVRLQQSLTHLSDQPFSHSSDDGFVLNLKKLVKQDKRMLTQDMIFRKQFFDKWHGLINQKKEFCVVCEIESNDEDYTDMEDSHTYFISPSFQSLLFTALFPIGHYLNCGFSDSETNQTYLLKPEDMTFEVWDYIFRDRPLPEDYYTSQPKENGPCPIPQQYLVLLRESFQYWYPVSMQVVEMKYFTNYVPFCIFSHCAIFDQKYWPMGLRATPLIILESKKIQEEVKKRNKIKVKKEERLVSLTKLMDVFGADPLRLAMSTVHVKIETVSLLFIFNIIHCSHLLMEELYWIILTFHVTQRIIDFHKVFNKKNVKFTPSLTSMATLTVNEPSENVENMFSSSITENDKKDPRANYFVNESSLDIHSFDCSPSLPNPQSSPNLEEENFERMSNASDESMNSCGSQSEDDHNEVDDDDDGNDRSDGTDNTSNKDMSLSSRGDPYSSSRSYCSTFASSYLSTATVAMGDEVEEEEKTSPDFSFYDYDSWEEGDDELEKLEFNIMPVPEEAVDANTKKDPSEGNETKKIWSSSTQRTSKYNRGIRFPQNLLNFRARLFRSQLNISIVRCNHYYMTECEYLVVKELFENLRLARDTFSLCGDVKMMLPQLKRYVYVFTVLLSPICPHWAEFVWSVVMQKKLYSIRNASWPKAGVIEYNLLHASGLMDEIVKQIRKRTLGKVSNDYTILVYVTDQYTPKQKLLLERMRKEADDHVDTMCGVVDEVLDEFKKTKHDVKKKDKKNKDEKTKSKKEKEKKIIKEIKLRGAMEKLLMAKKKELSWGLTFGEERYSTVVPYNLFQILKINQPFLHACTGFRHIFILPVEESTFSQFVSDPLLNPPLELPDVSKKVLTVSDLLYFQRSPVWREYVSPIGPEVVVLHDLDNNILQNLQQFHL
jgi:hypothetical protein